MSILAIDIGNSRTKLALCEPNGEGLPRCTRFVAIGNEEPAAIREKLAAFTVEASRAFVAASNGPLRDQLLKHWPSHSDNPTVISSWTQIPITLTNVRPETVGLDRLLNALGAKAIAPTTPMIVVDAGTATTVDIVVEGQFAGGAILPGLRLSARALHDYTSALPEIEIDELDPDSLEVPGTNTPNAIALGVLFGQVGAIREIVHRMQADHDKAALVFTGGAAKSLLSAFPEANHCPHLTLRALASLA